MKEKILNSLSVKLLSVSSNEGLSRIITTGFIMPFNPTVEEVADIKTAVSEAVTNSIVHGYKNEKDKFFYLTLTYYDSGRLTIVIKDSGCGIEDVALARTALYTTDSENERSGMGFSIMESFSDKMSVISKLGKGTRVTLTKYLKKNV